MTESAPPPYRALWEITRRCDLRCRHCLVDGGVADADELTTEESIDFVGQMADLGVRAVSLTGGEPLLREDWSLIAKRIREKGMILRWSMNGNLLDGATLEELIELETEAVAVSLDGMRETHDWLRRGKGIESTFDLVIEAINRLVESPISTHVITAVTRQNLSELPQIHELLKRSGVDVWFVQLAHSTGRLAKENVRSTKNNQALLAPEQMLELAEFLVKAAGDNKLQPTLHNSIGYLSSEEPILRASGRDESVSFWTGCECGVRSIGIEPDGGIKGCANQVGAPFVVGNLHTETLRQIWEDRARWHWLSPGTEMMTGACAKCELNKICKAGCTALARSATGELFNNPYCLRTIRGE